MDSKIIVAIIIAVGFVVGVYLYTQNTPFNRCVSAHQAIGLKYVDASGACITDDLTKY